MSLHLSHDMQGPIEVGDFYIWEPLKDHARAVVFVAQVKTNSDGELWALLANPLDPQEKAWWNDESRIREACVRIPIKGTAGRGCGMSGVDCVRERANPHLERGKDVWHIAKTRGRTADFTPIRCSNDDEGITFPGPIERRTPTCPECRRIIGLDGGAG